VLLVLAGLVFLAFRLVPQLEDWVRIEYSWPLIVVGVGALLLVMGLLFGSPFMAVPAFIVGGIGGLLYWQNVTGRWESWAYAWALIPGFAGLGTVVAGLLGGEPRKSIPSGLQTILVSLVLFAIFASFLGGTDFLGPYWPVLLIALGLILLIRPFFARRS
jgi:hypothetical protein